MKEKTVYALGYFDGVHIGHQALLQACLTLSQDLNAKPGVVTFVGHPQALTQGKAPVLINSLPDRRRLLEQQGAQRIVCLPFDEEMMHMPWQAFLQMLIEKHQAAGLVCGDDFRFGYRGEGTAQLLAQACREAGIACQVIPEQAYQGVRVSSTHIRELLEQGRMETAYCFLGHPHVLTARVVPGKQLGRTLGIPTANLQLPDGVVCPGKGVYACKASANGQTYLAVANIGTRPTVSGEGVSIEVWLLDFVGDLYGKEITVEFYAFLRPEQKFASLADLKAEIQKNAQQTRKILQK